MSAQLLDGKKISQTILAELKNQIEIEGLNPHLAIILIGEDPSSVTYVNQKKKKGEEIGVKVTIYQYPSTVKQKEVESKLLALNSDPAVTGIIVQLPLPDSFSKSHLLNLIDLQKDVDGLRQDTTFSEATPAGIMELLKRSQVQIEGQRAAVFGAGSLVGKPISTLLEEAGAQVNVIDINTPNPEKISQVADIVVVGIGQPKFITRKFIKNGAVVIDAGINRIDGKLVGDVDFDDVSPVASLITPVPGGVGPMTVAMLLKNVVAASRAS